MHDASQAVDFYRTVGTDGPPYTIGMGENQWPSIPSALRPDAEVYINKLLSLGESVMRAMAIGLEVDEDIFLSRIDKSFWNLRILGYEGRAEKKTMDAGIGAHTGIHHTSEYMTALLISHSVQISAS